MALSYGHNARLGARTITVLHHIKVLRERARTKRSVSAVMLLNGADLWYYPKKLYKTKKFFKKQEVSKIP
jgi:hypothetical protein